MILFPIDSALYDLPLEVEVKPLSRIYHYPLQSKVYSIINPYKQNPKLQMLKPQTSDNASPAFQEHGKDYADYSTYFGINNIKCSKKKACLKSIKECNGCSKCDCVKRNQGKRCDCKCTKCENFKLCKVEKDCQKFCQCSNPKSCKC